MNECVSVIVPIYNVEKYLLKCVDSIINQTHKNLEILLIDDGSTDSSGVIADQLSNSDARIKVIHKQNGGLSSARNKGLDICTGDYICFVDSDDYIKNTYVEELLNACVLYDSDLSMCFYFSVKNNEEFYNQEKGSNNCTSEILSPKQACMKYIETPYIVAWNKMYKRNLFCELRFPEGKLHEDVATTYKCFWNANKVVIINSELYGYRDNDNGIMKSKYTSRRYYELYAINEAIEYFEKLHEEEISECFYRLYFYRAILHMRYASKDQNLKYDYYRKIRSEAAEHLKAYAKKYKNRKELKSVFIGIYFPFAYYKIISTKRMVKNLLLKCKR